MIEGIVEVTGTIQVDHDHEITNLISLAKSALDGGNPSEALGYANRALEIDVDNWQAWAYKAKAVGWSSTLNNFRVAEMFASFNTAWEKAPEEKHGELKIEWAGDMLRISVAVHNMSWKHLNKFPGAKGAWQEHVNRCSQIFIVLDEAYRWDGQRAILENNIAMASNLIIGIQYSDDSKSIFLKVLCLKPELQQQMQARINKAGEEMRKFDPSYVTPKPKQARGRVVF